MKKKLMQILSAILAAIVLIFGAIFGTESTLKLSGEEIKGELVKIGELATMEYNYTHVSTLSKQKAINVASVYSIELPWSWANSTLVYSVDGCIKFGYNFEDIDVNVDDENNKITIKLPETKVLSNELDMKSVQVLDQKNGLFKSIDYNDIFDSEESIKEEELKIATEKGALESAKANATDLIKNALTGILTAQDYEVVVE